VGGLNNCGPCVITNSHSTVKVNAPDVVKRDNRDSHCAGHAAVASRLVNQHRGSGFRNCCLYCSVAPSPFGVGHPRAHPPKRFASCGILRARRSSAPSSNSPRENNPRLPLRSKLEPKGSRARGELGAPPLVSKMDRETASAELAPARGYSAARLEPRELANDHALRAPDSVGCVPLISTSELR